MSLVVPVAHDFTCGWCWIGLAQTRRLREEFDVEFEWRGYELYPEELAAEPPEIVIERHPNRPPTPTRFQLALAAEGMTLPKIARPGNIPTRLAHHLVEHAKPLGREFEIVERVYKAYFEHGMDISQPEVLRFLSTGIVANFDEVIHAFKDKRYLDRIVQFNHDAQESGVFNVPTFWIGGVRYAEQPYRVLQCAIREVLATAVVSV